MLYRMNQDDRRIRNLLLRLLALFDGRQRHRRRTEMDLLSLSPYLQRDIGFPSDD